MEVFEIKVINTVTNPSRIWFRYVDVTFVIKRQNTATSFYGTSTPLILTYSWLLRSPNTDKSIPFLDTSVSFRPDNTFSLQYAENLPTQTGISKNKCTFCLPNSEMTITSTVNFTINQTQSTVVTHVQRIS